ncbi:hypothetical protein BTO07_11590 [Polaribacter sp. SA4-12]|nr:hypothetical protein BTO07_11590 [Polaribacter sp. SA4-12]
MELLIEKVFFTIIYLLLIPFVRICFNFLSKKVFHLTEDRNNSFAPIFKFFLKFFKFYAFYLFPIMALLLIIGKWRK